MLCYPLLSPCDFPLISPRQLQIVDLDLMKAHRLSFDNSSPFLKEKKIILSNFFLMFFGRLYG